MPHARTHATITEPPVECPVEEETPAGLRILVIEDNPADARLTREALRDETGFHIDTAENLATALRALEHSSVDVILLDLSLPDSQGIATFESIHRAVPDAAIIVLSGLDDEELATRTVQMGGQDYIVKGEIEGHLLARAIVYSQKRKQLENQMRHLNRQLQRSNAELKDTQLQLIQAEKMESLGRLAAGVAHEVKNPLARILLGADYLAEGVQPDDPNLPSIISEIRSSAERADNIIRGMVEFSSARQLQCVTGDINAVIQRATLMVDHELIRGTIHLTTDLEEELPPASFDESKMEQVLVNLLMNSIQAMANGSGKRLTVHTRSGILPETDRNEGLRTREHMRAGDRIVRVEIEDEGCGISREKVDKLFDPFFTTKPAGEGTGLGLTVTRKIVELHGGSIEIANRPAGGAKATVILKASSDIDAGDREIGSAVNRAGTR